MLINIAHLLSSGANEEGPLAQKKEAMISILYDLVSQGKASRRNDFFSNCIKLFDFDFKILNENDVRNT
jgi:hypothetical protein